MSFPIQTRGLVALAALVAAALVSAAASRAQELSPDPELAEGRRHYRNNCAICHGIEGGGGRGPSLDRARFRRAPTRDALVRIIAYGIRGTEMPRSRWLTEEQRGRLADYVISLGKVEGPPPPGDPERGRAIYERSDCSNCHTMGGSGGRFGPDLTEIGLRRSPLYLRDSLVRPGSEVPDNFLIVRATGDDGQTAEGIRINEDSFTIQLRDIDDRLYSFRKSELKSLNKQFGKTPMSSYAGKMNEDEITDLVAYLASLRGNE